MNKRMLATIPAAFALALGTPGIAHAAPVADVSEGPADVLAIAGNVKFAGDTATVSFVYKCTGEPVHVWASVKQLEDPNAVADWTFDSHGTSGKSRAWYDTHSVAQCFGDKAQRVTLTMQRADFSRFGGPAWHQLRNGVGYVQICLTQGGGETEQPTAFAALNDWVRVH
jgi:hypothetical protein